jgi:flagellar export protein FliJ
MAKRFEFRLQTVLRIRKQDEDACKRVVADRLRRINAVHSEVVALQGQIAGEVNAFRQTHAVGRLDMRQVMQHRHWLIHLHQGVLMAHSRLAELQRQLEQDRIALTEARRRVRVLEKLKERQYERYRHELNRLEARENDEIGNTLYLRQRMLAVE